MRKKQLIMLVMGLVLVPFLMSTASAKTLKIGSMGPLTGPYAADGNDIKNGVLTAIEVINDEGGIPGFDKIELFHHSGLGHPGRRGHSHDYPGLHPPGRDRSRPALYVPHVRAG